VTETTPDSVSAAASRRKTADLKKSRGRGEVEDATGTFWIDIWLSFNYLQQMNKQVFGQNLT
jgi:hypothetical protein